MDRRKRYRINNDADLRSRRDDMARAHRHFIAGQVWHITQRCHQREFLLGSDIDRRRWVYWLFQARKRFGLSVLDYVVTRNHIHLLVKDTGPGVIASSMQLISGRTAQEFNRRQERRGAFWEDRYHATAVQSDLHLARALVYIDLNMVRAGVVKHPSEWKRGGYAELQRPRRRGGRLDYEALQELLRCGSLRELQLARQSWVEQKLEEEGCLKRVPEWTESLAVGSFHYAVSMLRHLAASHPGRKTVNTPIGHVVREPSVVYLDSVP
jgi:putative transposase